MADPVGRLPPLRDDLRLMPGPAGADGAPSWTLYDPAAHRYLRLGWLEFEILARWQLGDAAAIAQAIANETPIRASVDDVADMVRFAGRAGLLRPLDPASSRQMAELRQRRKLSPQRWLLKNYLFLRVTLLDPDHLLAALLPWTAWAFRPWFPAALAALAALGLTLVGRRWDLFTHELSYAFSPEGALLTALALSLAKVVHETGHGIAAKRFGCRVPAMGIALLVLWPVLWTDVTDSWKLTDRRQRLAIDAAGMAAEILLAVAASILWSALPDGPVRSAVFLLAGSTWVMTLTVNLNPFMRFDGYFLLSDWLDVPNLQDRAFALGRWWLRETLFGLGAPPPEVLSPRLRRGLVLYALSVWIYRFFLFLGIAFLVYHLAFKLLGLFLMGVEIWWFVARPILAELHHWLGLRRTVGWNPRSIRTAMAAALLGLLALLPWHGRVVAPAILRAERQATLKTATSGVLKMLAPEGAGLAEGQPAFVLQSPDLEHRRAIAVATASGQRARLSGLSFDREDSGGIEVNWQEFERSVAEIAEIDTESEALVVRAPFPGRVVDLPPALIPGLWMAKHEEVAVLVDPSSAIVETFVQEEALDRLRPGANASFLPEDGGPAIAVTVSAVDRTPTKDLQSAELASLYGGPIPVRQDAAKRLKPEKAIYRVLLKPDGNSVSVAHRRPGTISIQGDTASLAAEAWRRAAAILVQESGF